jgi:hypothetical protein
MEDSLANRLAGKTARRRSWRSSVAHRDSEVESLARCRACGFSTADKASRIAGPVRILCRTTGGRLVKLRRCLTRHCAMRCAHAQCLAKVTVARAPWSPQHSFRARRLRPPRVYASRWRSTPAKTTRSATSKTHAYRRGSLKLWPTVKSIAYLASPREVGNASLIGKGKRITVGSLVEAIFLYATEGKHLHQPRIKELAH